MHCIRLKDIVTLDRNLLQVQSFKEERQVKSLGKKDFYEDSIFTMFGYKEGKLVCHSCDAHKILYIYIYI